MKRSSLIGFAGVALFSLLLTTGVAKQAGAEAIKRTLIS